MCMADVEHVREQPPEDVGEGVLQYLQGQRVSWHLSSGVLLPVIVGHVPVPGTALCRLGLKQLMYQASPALRPTWALYKAAPLALCVPLVDDESPGHRHSMRWHEIGGRMTGMPA